MRLGVNLTRYGQVACRCTLVLMAVQVFEFERVQLKVISNWVSNWPDYLSESMSVKLSSQVQI